MRTAIMVLATACAAAASAAPRVTIDLLPNPEVQGDTVVLGQVAHLRSPDLELMRRLVHLPVGRSPRNGELAVLRQEALGLWIRRHTGLTAGEVELRGSQESRVLGTARRVKGEDIGQAAVEALRRWAGTAEDVRVRVPVRGVDVPGTPVRLEPRPIEQAAPRRHMVVWVDVWAAGALVRTVPVSLHVASGDMPVRAVTGSDAPLIAESPTPVARAAAREPLGVVRGDWATLRSTTGPVVLEVAVEVLQDGRAGDKVRVRQRGAGAVMTARVVGPAQLELAP